MRRTYFDKATVDAVDYGNHVRIRDGNGVGTRSDDFAIFLVECDIFVRAMALPDKNEAVVSGEACPEGAWKCPEARFEGIVNGGEKDEDD